MDFEEQLDQLDRLQDQLRAEIHMDFEMNDEQIADQFGFERPEGNAGDPQPERNQNEQQPAGDAPRENLVVPEQGEHRQEVEAGNPAAIEEANVAGASAAKTEKEEQDESILTPNGVEMKGFSCMICYDPFNTGKRIPKVFPCGHTFCLSCVGGLMKNRSFLSSSTVICPTCRQNTRYSMSLGADKVPTNFSVLSMLEQRNEEKNSPENKEMLQCNDCHEIFAGTEVTNCSEKECQDAVKDEILDVDSINRLKSLLICRSCIDNKHSRHNFTSFEKVAAQYEVNEKICLAEAKLVKGLKAADDTLVSLKLTETEVSEHRRRMVNALKNIRAEADHPLIYEYLNQYTTSVKASEELFKRLIGDLNDFEVKSKARYYRSFGSDMLRPISITQRITGRSSVEIKQEPRDDTINPQPRDRGQRNRLPNRNARINFFGAIPARIRPVGADPLADQIPNIENMLDQVLQHFDGGVVPDRLRFEVGGAIPPVPEVLLAQRDAAAAAAAGDAPGAADGAVPRDPRDELGVNRMNLWALRAPILPRRLRRNENARDLRAIRVNLVAAMAANPVLEGIPAVRQAIDGLRDRDNVLEHGFLFGRRNPIPIPDNAAFARELERAEDQLNRLRQRLARLEGAEAADVQPNMQIGHADIAVPAPLPWVDRIIEEPLPQLPAIEGYDQEVIQRAEIAELVQRVIGMVRNEAHAEAAANGEPVPDHIEMPHLLNAEAIPGVPDYNQLAPVQVAPFLVELRALELEWIQRGRDRRARALPAVAEPPNGPMDRIPNEQVANEIAEPVVPEPENNVDRDLHRRPASPIPDEPAAKRNRQ